MSSAKSYSPGLKDDNASSGSLNVSTSNRPLASNPQLYCEVISGLSSTANILLLLLLFWPVNTFSYCKLTNKLYSYVDRLNTGTGYLLPAI
jgi:hypothetical protein